MGREVAGDSVVGGWKEQETTSNTRRGNIDQRPAIAEMLGKPVQKTGGRRRRLLLPSLAFYTSEIHPVVLDEVHT